MDQQHAYRRQLRTYAIGFVSALVLTCAAFATVRFHLAPPQTAIGIVFALGLVQIVVHFRFFLHIDLERSARDDLQLILFSTLITLLMVGGTLVILANLHHRMM
ncbi:cytochrome o ubiquinol oxidase subunit IV [Stakelama pacifica]|uniref:Cytochrome bo(3) ubiquinol oxidase subunit 4 n=1 Tax=Stakelama pacifica TaxID=517720 RepID=A0A4R6FPE2_9SPHN|nr:cytochrome o ubiquinol oxidase subunit IV [Stakelama pacifica]TDN82950.1 cytochrome o ubiquinol oxidase operon protein cyoD [Stakelama pacifica]GGO95111.1 cytochrome bo(3) ubiquinol oxidase subunit 4 [Stakelama pacifica]